MNERTAILRSVHPALHPDLSQQPLQVPKLGRQLRGHRGRHPQPPRSPAEIEVGHVERDGRVQVLQFLGESERQSRESPHERAEREVVPLDMGRADGVGIVDTPEGATVRLNHVRRTVPSRLLRFSEGLDEDPVSRLIGECQIDRSGVGDEPVHAQLGPSLGAMDDPAGKVEHEPFGDCGGPLADGEAWDKLGGLIDADKEVLVPDHGVVATDLDVGLFHPDEGPNLVDLNMVQA